MALKEIQNQGAGDMSVSEMAASPARGLKFIPQHPSQKMKTKQTKNTCLYPNTEGAETGRSLELTDQPE